jgi:hypothetical protein
MASVLSVSNITPKYSMKFFEALARAFWCKSDFRRRLKGIILRDDDHIETKRQVTIQEKYKKLGMTVLCTREMLPP